jgi:hypothetical protein
MKRQELPAVVTLTGRRPVSHFPQNQHAKDRRHDGSKKNGDFRGCEVGGQRKGLTSDE